jgi:hypothetical protein
MRRVLIVLALLLAALLALSVRSGEPAADLSSTTATT